MKIVIPGGSGQVGTILARAFQKDGHEVVVLSRAAGKAPWGVVTCPWVQCIEGADVVINLAGRSVNCRYTRHDREAIKQSRLLSTRAVGDAIAAAILKSRRVVPGLLTKRGFTFQFPRWSVAAQDLCLRVGRAAV